ncbi:MAG: hypothetical protein KIT74_08895 [Fimbriimonadales bacterium]|nr:hypothetical protein [Fimbriimonadales bacterium]
MKVWQALLNLDRRILYLILMLLVGWQIVAPIDADNVVSAKTQDLFASIDAMKEGDVVVVQSDWTNSTRGESRSQFQALMRHLMRKRVKIILTSIDPQAIEVARVNLEEVAKEPGNNNYELNRDYVIGGYFPDAYNYVFGMVNNIRKELAAKGVLGTPVMENINDLSDCKAVILVTASASINVWYQRMRSKTDLALFCTAVMSAENIPYYASGQLVGLAIGAKGAFDYETLLEEKYGSQDGMINIAAGKRYMGPLAFALMLLIVAVVFGNIAMVMVRKGGSSS